MERRVITQEEFIGSTCRIEYVIHADRLKDGNQTGRIIVRSPYQKLVYEIMASRGPRIRADVKAEEKTQSFHDKRLSGVPGRHNGL